MSSTPWEDGPVLGIETSCDETAAAVVDRSRAPVVLSDVVASQVALHAPHGGVVPELASRQHLRDIRSVVERAVEDSGIGLDGLGGVAVTAGPGLVGALLVGVSFAKSLALARGLPLVGVNHLEGHVRSAFLEAAEPDEPYLALVVSGGHSSLIRVERQGPSRAYAVLARTLDDAAGEAFDKVGKLLGLPYPAGPVIDRLVDGYGGERVHFPRARIKVDGGRAVTFRAFSFSGVKTSVRHHVEKHGVRPVAEGEDPAARSDLFPVLAGFQEAVVDMLVSTTLRMLVEEGVSHLVAVGGVSANRALRRRLTEGCGKAGVSLLLPPPRWSTDNAAMIAEAGSLRLAAGERAGVEAPGRSGSRPRRGGMMMPSRRSPASRLARSLAAGALLVAVLSACPGTSARSPSVSEEDATAPAANDALSQLSGRLRTRIDGELNDACLANARVAVLVREMSTGRTLYTRRGEEPLVPASNQKLITAAALLGLLGPEHVIRTPFRGDRLPGVDGHVGVLYVVGRGDPALTIESIHSACRSLAAAGVRHVTRVVADDTYFEGPFRPPTWPERNHAYWYGAPSAALSTNFAVVAVHVRGAEDGTPPRAWVDPFPAYFDIDCQLSRGRGPWSIRSEPLPDRQRLTVLGRMADGKSDRELRAVDDPVLFAAHGITESLRRVGIAVAEPPRRGRAPEGSVLLHSHPSKPLSLLVHDMNKQSSNVFAETLVKVLGAELLGEPGTREKGLAVLQRFLDTAADRPGGCRLHDGSGLSPENRVTARVLTDLLLHAAADPFTYPEFLVALPVGGVDGTLKQRLRDGRSRRLVRAKTGRLAGVVALSGIALVEDRTQAVFSILVNDYHCPTWKVQDAVDRLLGDIVAEATAVPDFADRIVLDDLRGGHDEHSNATAAGR